MSVSSMLSHSSERLRGELPSLLGLALTPAELGVLKLISQGYTYVGIAHARARHLQTIKGEVLRVYKKLGARNAAHAVAIAIDKGLI